MDDQIFPRGRPSRNDIDMGNVVTFVLCRVIEIDIRKWVG